MKKLQVWFASLFILLAVQGRAQTTEIIDIPSKIFHGIRKVKICLPQGYNDYPNRKYNVIYFFDAQSDEFFNYVKATIDYLGANADIFISPVILVGIQTDDRRFEFLPKNQTDQPLKDYGTSVRLGGADSLALHLKKEVFPVIQQKFRCNSFNIAIGHSLSASFITYTMIKYPELFNTTIAISPNYYYDNEQLLHVFSNLTSYHTLNKKILYIAYGKDDKTEERFRKSTIKMDSILSKKKIKGLIWQVQSLDNNSHSTTPLEGIFKGLMAFNRELIPSEQQIETFYNDRQISFTDNLKKYYKSRADSYNIQLPTIEDINHIAYNCFYSQKNNDAIEVLKWAISMYPDDTNLFDSMGEIEQGAGNVKEALSFYTKGLEIVEQQKANVPIDTYERLKKGFESRIKSVVNSK